jgi:hypothetical protein
VAVQSPGGLAFALVTLDEDRPAPAELADEALAAMRDEYPQLDASPALETIDGHRAVGHDLEFISLDLVNSCAIRCYRTPRRTVLVFASGRTSRGTTPRPLLRAVRGSLEETDSEAHPGPDAADDDGHRGDAHINLRRARPSGDR